LADFWAIQLAGHFIDDIVISSYLEATLAQLVVRNLEEGVKTKLQRRARRNGHSMEEEARDILRNAVKQEEESSSKGLGTEISALFAKIGLNSDIPELRGREITPVSFGE